MVLSSQAESLGDSGALPSILSALYLRGAPRSFDTKRNAWPVVERSLRRRNPSLGAASDALRQDGLWSEAMALETPGLLTWAERQISESRVLTAAHEAYPRRWLERLGASAPPAVWIEGPLPYEADGLKESPLFLAIVGSRVIGPYLRRFAAGCAAEAMDLGYMVVSGGARGCDLAALNAVHRDRRVTILPFGLEACSGGRESIKGFAAPAGCVVSVCAPQEEFSSANAMERNALIYSMSEAAIIVHARFKTGGTWHGAIEAQRRRLTRFIVRDDTRNPAHQSLMGLGGVPLKEPIGLREALRICCDAGPCGPDCLDFYGASSDERLSEGGT